MTGRSITVQVVYALPECQRVAEVTVPVGSTAGDAIAASNLLREFPEIDLSRNSIGVYSRLIEPDTIVHEGDRVEIYRPLTIDPKEARRKRGARSRD